jgi:hypothetical protein
MHVVFHPLLGIAAVALVACIVWLHWRALQDGAIQDVLLFLTGVSILSYIFNRWDRVEPARQLIQSVMPLVFPAVVMRHAKNGASRPPRAARNGTGSERLLAAKNSPEILKRRVELRHGLLSGLDDLFPKFFEHRNGLDAHVH